MAKVEWTNGALRDLQSIDKLISQRIIEKITWFSNNFEKLTPEPLSGKFKGAYKIRVGDWRVIYTIEDKTIVILALAHRKEIYK